MDADTVALALIVIAAPPATLFPLVLGFTTQWWRRPITRALMTKAVGLALLIDISLVYTWFGDDYALREVVRLTVFALIALGAWMQFGALIAEKRRDRRDGTDHWING